MRQLITLVLIFVLWGCAAPMALTTTRHTEHYKAQGDGNGHVYIYRERDFAGSARGIYITGNGARIGGVNDGTYFVYEASPGAFTISAENSLDSADIVKRSISVEPNKSYFLRASFKTGFIDAKPYIEIVSDLEGSQAVQGLSYETLVSHLN